MDVTLVKFTRAKITKTPRENLSSEEGNVCMVEVCAAVTYWVTQVYRLKRWRSLRKVELKGE